MQMLLVCSSGRRPCLLAHRTLGKVEEGEEPEQLNVAFTVGTQMVVGSIYHGVILLCTDWGDSE